MRHFVLLIALLFSAGAVAVESTVTVPWQEFDDLYRGQVHQGFKDLEKPQPRAVIVLETALYQLAVSGLQVAGSVEITGTVLAGDPEPVPLFSQSVVVTDVFEANNVVLLAGDGKYSLHTLDAGDFSIRFAISVPILDFKVKPRIAMDVPPAVRNKLQLESSEQFEVLASDTLHPIGDDYFFSPRRSLNVEFAPIDQPRGDAAAEHRVLAEVNTPDAVLESVTFFSSFTEDGTVLTAMLLRIPAGGDDQLELEPVEGAEVWSLQVNQQPRSLYRSAANKWVIPLDAKTGSTVELAYLSRGQKLGLEGRLQLDIPETGLTARKVNLIVGLPERTQMLAMDSDLLPSSDNQLATFASFSGNPHYFSKPFYRGRAFSASIIYQEPVNP